MSKTMLICKACGKEYEACRTPNPGVFRWRDIACSIECAQKYIHDVMVARGEITDDVTEDKATQADDAVVTDVTEVADIENTATDIQNATKSVKASRNRKKQ